MAGCEVFGNGWRQCQLEDRLGNQAFSVSSYTGFELDFAVKRKINLKCLKLVFYIKKLFSYCLIIYMYDICQEL